MISSGFIYAKLESPNSCIRGALSTGRQKPLLRTLRQVHVICAIAVCLIFSAHAWPQDVPPSIAVQSNAPSLTITYLHRDHDQFVYEIRNNSSREVTKYDLKLSLADPTVPAGTVLGHILPGATFLYAPPGNLPGGAVTAIVLTAAVFADDTFEGDEMAAAGISVRSIGHDGQYAHIESIVRPILADAATDERTKISQIRTQVGRLSEEPDLPTVERYARMFPTLVDVSRPVRSKNYDLLKYGYAAEKRFVLQTLKQFTCGDYPAGTSLDEWWKTTREDAHYAQSACAKD